MYEFSTFMQIYICMHDTRVNACMSMWVQATLFLSMGPTWLFGIVIAYLLIG